MNRTDVFRVLDTERYYQDKSIADSDQPPSPPDVATEILAMELKLGAAVGTSLSQDTVATLGLLREVTAIAVRCFEHYGVPARQATGDNSPMDRASVYAVIDGERDYQESLNSDWTHQGHPSINQEILLMQEYLDKSKSLWASTYGSSTPALDAMRKVAGIGVRCFEHHGVRSRLSENPAACTFGLEYALARTTEPDEREPSTRPTFTFQVGRKAPQ